MLFLPARSEESLRESAVQQRRLRALRENSGADRRLQHAPHSRPRGLPRGGVDRTAGLRPERPRRNRSAAGRYGHGHRLGADRADVRAAGEDRGRAGDRRRAASDATRPRRAFGRGSHDRVAPRIRSERRGAPPHRRRAGLGHRHRGGRLAARLASGGGHGALRRRRELLRRLPQRDGDLPGYRAHPLRFAHAAGDVPPTLPDISARRSTSSAAAMFTPRISSSTKPR